MPRINPITGEREVVPPTKGSGQTQTTTDETTDESTNTNPYMQTKPPGMPEDDWEKYQEGLKPPKPKPEDISNFNIGDYKAKNNQAYYDATKSTRQTYAEAVANAQNEQTAKMNSGTGAAAAVGTAYSWETKGKDLAENAYQQKVLEEKQGMLTQRQELEKNAQQYQTQADMQKYSDNQTADKVGWTGGYVLDQERQREYMKQSIQAQLYGAMELQKYGYDTAMAAARLSYDANLLNYSQEYYNQAVQNALNEAQVTGVYFSAEVKDMLSQYTIAEAKLQDSTLSEDEKARAQKVKDTIDNWFGSENNISKEGIKTLEAWNAEQSLELQWSQELWTQYNAALQSIKEDINKQTTFIALDENGNYIYDGNTVRTIDMTNMSNKDLAQYAKLNGQNRQQVESYIAYLAEQIKNENTKRDEKTGVVSYDNENLQKEYNALKEKIANINEEFSKGNGINTDTSSLDTLVNNTAVNKNITKEGMEKFAEYVGKAAENIEETSYAEFKKLSPFSADLTKEIYTFISTHSHMVISSTDPEYLTLVKKAKKEYAEMLLGS
jgi:hypothetical protein